MAQGLKQIIMFLQADLSQLAVFVANVLQCSTEADAMLQKLLDAVDEDWKSSP